MAENSKDIGAGRYTTDENRQAGKYLAELDEVYKKNHFEISVTMERKDFHAKKYPSGLIKVTLSNLSPETILPQIPLHSMDFYYEIEKTRSDLRGKNVNEVLANIITRKERQMEKMNDNDKKREERKNQQDIFNQDINNDRDGSTGETSILSNTIKKEKETQKTENKNVKKQQSFGGLFDYAKPNTNNTNNVIKSNSISVSNIDDNSNNIIQNRNEKVKEKTEQHKSDFAKKVESEFSHVNQKKAVSERRKNKITFNEKTINMF